MWITDIWQEQAIAENIGYGDMEILDIYMKKWNLIDVKFDKSISYNSYIHKCTSPVYGKCILKVLLNDTIDYEIEALNLFQGDVFCRMFEYSISDKVYLIEYITPGDTLFKNTTRDERIFHISKIFGKIHVAPSPIFPTYLNWLEYGESGSLHRTDCRHLFHHVERAKKIIRDINKMYPEQRLLHGDLHHENILKNNRGGYTVIDPKGVIGNPVFDLSRFILDEFHDNLTSEPAENIIGFVKSLGKAVGYPHDVLLQCLYAETVIWLFREQFACGDSIENCDWLIRNIQVSEFLCK